MNIAIGFENGVNDGIQHRVIAVKKMMDGLIPCGLSLKMQRIQHIMDKAFLLRVAAVQKCVKAGKIIVKCVMGLVQTIVDHCILGRVILMECVVQGIKSGIKSFCDGCIHEIMNNRVDGRIVHMKKRMGQLTYRIVWLRMDRIQ